VAWAKGASAFTQRGDWSAGIQMELRTDQAGDAGGSSGSTAIGRVSGVFGSFRLSMARMGGALLAIKPSTLCIRLLNGVIVPEAAECVAYTVRAACRTNSW
jgi:hypothetical protein